MLCGASWASLRRAYFASVRSRPSGGPGGASVVSKFAEKPLVLCAILFRVQWGPSATANTFNFLLPKPLGFKIFVHQEDNIPILRSFYRKPPAVSFAKKSPHRPPLSRVLIPSRHPLPFAPHPFYSFVSSSAACSQRRRRRLYHRSSFRWCRRLLVLSLLLATWFPCRRPRGAHHYSLGIWRNPNLAMGMPCRGGRSMPPPPRVLIFFLPLSLALCCAVPCRHPSSPSSSPRAYVTAAPCHSPSPPSSPPRSLSFFRY
jgi:hypothetical protein